MEISAIILEGGDIYIGQLQSHESKYIHLSYLCYFRSSSVSMHEKNQNIFIVVYFNFNNLHFLSKQSCVHQPIYKYTKETE